MRRHCHHPTNQPINPDTPGGVPPHVLQGRDAQHGGRLHECLAGGLLLYSMRIIIQKSSLPIHLSNARPPPPTHTHNPNEPNPENKQVVADLRLIVQNALFFNEPFSSKPAAPDGSSPGAPAAPRKPPTVADEICEAARRMDRVCAFLFLGVFCGWSMGDVRALTDRCYTSWYISPYTTTTPPSQFLDKQLPMTYLRIWEHAEREAELKEPLKKVIYIHR